MKTVGAHEARLNLASLLDEVERGKSITIKRFGEPVAVLVPADKRTRPAVRAAVALSKKKGKKKSGRSRR